MSKLFVRARRHVGKGAGRPRFAIVAAQGADLKVFKTRVRRAELEKIAAEIGAEVVHLPRGEKADAEQKGSKRQGSGRRRRDKK